MRFTVDVIRFVDTFPRSWSAPVIARQLASSAGSVGANYREANRAESTRDFAHSLARVVKEASESDYWLEVAIKAKFGDGNQAANLRKEAGELLRIFNASLRTVRRRARNRAVAKSLNRKIAKSQNRESTSS